MHLTLSRGRTLAAAAVAAAAVAGGVVVASTGDADATPRHDPFAWSEPGKAKNIILLVGDGMGVTHIDAARQRYYGAAGKLNMEQLPALGTVSTYAVERDSDHPELVTDSASSGTAWSSGVKTYNAALGKDAYGTVVPTIMEEAKAAGLRTGNVSTAEITDATPAAMMSHASQRSCQGPKVTDACLDTGGEPDAPIAEQIARNGTADVIFGGGLSRFEPDDQQALQDQGYQVLGTFGDPALIDQTAESQTVATEGDLAGVSEGKVIGLFNRGNLTIEKYKREHPDAPEAAEPTLAEMTTKAIDLLKADKKDKGFFLQVEGALIDKRSHANDAAQTLEEMEAFDAAVKAATEFAKADGNTLVIVTADHECAGFNIIGKGSYANAEAVAPPANADSGNPANDSTPARAASGALDPLRSMGPVNSEAGAQAGNFGPATFRTADDPAEVQDGTPEASLWLTYLSGNHTGAAVNMYAGGPGSKNFDQKIDNTDIYHRMRWSLQGL